MLLGSEICAVTYTRRALNGGGATTGKILEAVLVARFLNASAGFATAVPEMEYLLEHDENGPGAGRFNLKPRGPGAY